jgi:hypothetical protein
VKQSAYTGFLISLSQPREGSHSHLPQGRAFSEAFGDLFRYPQRAIRLWNWKSAVLSLVLRGPIFLVATVRRGWEAALAALLTESVFCVLSAGFYGAVVQTLRDAQPLWLTLLFITVVMPAAFQLLEYGLHRLRGTPHLIPAEIVSLIVSGISALFNWYAMQRGTLLVGGEGRAFGKDVQSLPRLIFSFIVLLPTKMISMICGERRP